MKTLLIKANQTISVVEIDGFGGLREYFNGFPEFVYPRRLQSPFCLAVDDMGKLKSLPQNDFGCYLYESDKHGRVIVGDIFLMKRKVLNDGSYDVVGLTDSDINELTTKYNISIG